MWYTICFLIGVLFVAIIGIIAMSLVKMSKKAYHEAEEIGYHLKETDQVHHHH